MTKHRFVLWFTGKKLCLAVFKTLAQSLCSLRFLANPLASHTSNVVSWTREVIRRASDKVIIIDDYRKDLRKTNFT